MPLYFFVNIHVPLFKMYFIYLLCVFKSHYLFRVCVWWQWGWVGGAGGGGGGGRLHSGGPRANLRLIRVED
jgi:hypothetical protein